MRIGEETEFDEENVGAKGIEIEWIDVSVLGRDT